MADTSFNKHIDLDLKNLAYILVKCQQNFIECEKTGLVIFKHQRKK